MRKQFFQESRCVPLVCHAEPSETWSATHFNTWRVGPSLATDSPPSIIVPCLWASQSNSSQNKLGDVVLAGSCFPGISLSLMQLFIPDVVYIPPLRNIRRMNEVLVPEFAFLYVVTRYIHTVVQHCLRLCLRLYHRRGAKPIVLHRYPPRGLIWGSHMRLKKGFWNMRGDSVHDIFR
jgi:hypothetical protein